MTTQTQVELEAFRRFLSRQINDSETELTPEECLELWRAEHPASGELEESIKAVKRALQEADSGEGCTLEDFDREFRKKHNIPAR